MRNGGQPGGRPPFGAGGGDGESSSSTAKPMCLRTLR